MDSEGDGIHYHNWWKMVVEGVRKGKDMLTNKVRKESSETMLKREVKSEWRFQSDE